MIVVHNALFGGRVANGANSDDDDLRAVRELGMRGSPATVA